jgi:ribosomal protein S18 acetylase RimI-like enzyme
MAQIRNMHEHEAERVRDLWLQMCAEAGTPLPEKAAQQILAHLKQYAAHQDDRCFVAEEQHLLIGFLTCSVGRSGEIEELYVQPGHHLPTVQADLVKQAVTFMQARGARSIHVRVGIWEESPEEAEQRVFWQSLGWENDMTIYSIYSNVPGNPALQRVWDEYQARAQAETDQTQPPG